ncbi:MAG: Gfo/Idh/MocA family oxidoreductase [Candidatus Methylarchaceae archaeon HK01M]|nr:Gfo/Idh/MocA family oxidoreductase [Candidatus Methylarchaceae archaeon HK01M]
MSNIGVIGVGGWGKNHLRVLNDLGVLSSFCDIDEDKVKIFEKRYQIRGYKNIDEMLKNERLDAVTICTPTVTHYEIAEKTIGAGLDTFVEKPLTYTSIEGERLIKLAEDKGAIMTVGFIERFNPVITELKNLLKVGKLGEPLLLEFHRENVWTGKVKDVGIIMDTAVHDIDTARWIFNEEPKVTFARAGKVLNEHEGPDFAAITLGFHGEKTAFIVANWLTPKKIRELEVVCIGGIVTIDFITQELKIDRDEGTIIPRRKWEEPLLIELKEFVKCITERSRPIITGIDGINVTKIAEASTLSHETGSHIYLDL